MKPIVGGGCQGVAKMTGRTYRLCIGSFDLIKGFAICVVIFGHIATLFDVRKLTWFYPVLIILEYLKTPIIPLFFIISGYGFVENKISTVIRKTVKSLILPYAVIMVCFCVLQPFFALLQGAEWRAAIEKSISIALAFLLGLPIPGKLLFGIRLSHCAIVWFLLTLFWAQNILNLILKIKSIAVQIVLLLLAAAAGYWLFQLEMTYYCIPHGLIATSYVYLGHVMKKYRIIQKAYSAERSFSAWIIGAGWVMIAVLYAQWGVFDLCYGKFSWFPVDYIGVMFLSVLLFAIGVILGQLDWRIFDLIQQIGGYSYWVFCIHSVEQKCLPWDKFIRVTAEYPNVGFVLALVIKAVIIAFFCRIVKRLSKERYRKKKQI